jgi:hypothetical protein
VLVNCSVPFGFRNGAFRECGHEKSPVGIEAGLSGSLENAQRAERNLYPASCRHQYGLVLSRPHALLLYCIHNAISGWGDSQSKSGACL